MLTNAPKTVPERFEIGAITTPQSLSRDDQWPPTSIEILQNHPASCHSAKLIANYIFESVSCYQREYEWKVCFLSDERIVSNVIEVQDFAIGIPNILFEEGYT